MNRADLDQLLNFLLPFAQQQFKKQGEFFPFGAAMTADGRIQAVDTHDGREQPPSQELIDMLIQGFQIDAAEGQLRAIGICADVLITPPGSQDKTDAVRVSLEHVEGEAVDVYLPYRKRFLKRFSFGELFAMQRTPVVFPARS